MANVSNVRLAMGRRNEELEIGTVSCNVNFSRLEIEQDMAFAVYIALYEVDGERDMFHYTKNGAFDATITRAPSPDKKDDFVQLLSSEVIRPSGSSTRFLERSVDFDVGEQEKGKEEYEAVVWVVPEVTEGIAWSNRVRRDLG